MLALDIITKRWAMSALDGRPSELFGGIIPLNLAFNRGAAFGLSIGNDPRWFFIPVTILALGLLTYLLVRTDVTDRFRIFALSLVLTGALGNLIDRIRWDMGVVDFIATAATGNSLFTTASGQRPFQDVPIEAIVIKKAVRVGES